MYMNIYWCVGINIYIYYSPIYSVKQSRFLFSLVVSLVQLVSSSVALPAKLVLLFWHIHTENLSIRFIAAMISLKTSKTEDSYSDSEESRQPKLRSYTWFVWIESKSGQPNSSRQPKLRSYTWFVWIKSKSGQPTALGSRSYEATPDLCG